MCFGQTTLKIRVIYTLSSNKKPLEHQYIGAPKQHRKTRPYSAEEKLYERAVIYPQKLGTQSVRIPARSRTAATCRRLPRANHHPVNPQQAAEPIGAS